ncbi:MAG TPA: PKD domain-containing protein, partial [Thermoplasmata archaeon]|nr:PKD domain-containing protein [Thermoplasmata archaeon]
QVVFDASGSSDNVGIVEYQWTFTDSGSPVTLSGPSPVYTFQGEGTFPVALRVTDSSGNTATDTLTVVVAAAPVIFTTPVPSAGVGVPVTFDGTASTGNITSWTWTIATESGAVLVTLEGPIVSYTFTDAGDYRINLTVTDIYGRTEKHGFDVVVTAIGAGEGSAWVPALLATGAAITAVLFAASEPGRVALLTATAARWYGRKPKDEKDSEIRGAILYYVRVHPGDCYMDIKRNLDLNDGVVTYHLALLEREELVRSAVRGARRRYYPAGMHVPLENGGELHEIQQRLLRFVAKQPGMPVALLAEQTGVSYQLALYHLRRLARSDHVGLERRGLRLHASPGNAAEPPPAAQKAPPPQPPRAAPPPPPRTAPASKECPACGAICAGGDTACFMCGATL